MGVAEHPCKVVVAATEPDAGLPERGWVDMDVRWLVTKDTVGSTKTVFGVTFFPPGAKHDLHRHPNAEEVEYLVSGSGIAYVGDDVVMAWYYAGAASLEDAGFVTRDEDEAAD
jgi:uncharacterized RmlC-like cupin family protein